VHHTLLLLLPFLLVGLSGCEGCDFSYGPLPLMYTVTLVDAQGEPTAGPLRHGLVEYCDTDGSCGSAPLSLRARSTVHGSVGWEGYVTCRVPDVTVWVTVEGCEPTEDLVRGSEATGGSGALTGGTVLRCDAHSTPE